MKDKNKKFGAFVIDNLDACFMSMFGRVVSMITFTADDKDTYLFE